MRQNFRRPAMAKRMSRGRFLRGAGIAAATGAAVMAGKGRRVRADAPVEYDRIIDANQGGTLADIQDAVNAGGKILLRGTFDFDGGWLEIYNFPPPYPFSTSLKYVEIVGENATIINGGPWTFDCWAPAPTHKVELEVKNLNFKNCGSFVVTVWDFGSLEADSCRIEDTLPVYSIPNTGFTTIASILGHNFDKFIVKNCYVSSDASASEALQDGGIVYANPGDTQPGAEVEIADNEIYVTQWTTPIEVPDEIKMFGHAGIVVGSPPPFFSSKSAIVAGNNVNGGDTGINIGWETGVILKNNTINGFREFGIFMLGDEGTILQGNILRGMGVFAIISMFEPGFGVGGGNTFIGNNFSTFTSFTPWKAYIEENNDVMIGVGDGNVLALGDYNIFRGVGSASAGQLPQEVGDRISQIAQSLMDWQPQRPE